MPVPDRDEDTARRQLRAQRASWLWILVGSLCLGGGTGIYFLASESGSAPAGAATSRAEDATLVETVTATARTGEFTITAPGRLQPRQTLEIVGEVAGKVTRMHPDLARGGRIEAGEMLLRIDPGDYRADLAQAEAQLATAQANLKRVVAEQARQARLAEIGATPQAALEAAVAGEAEARATLRQAEARLDIASRNLSKTTIRSPFPALVMSESVSEDTYVAPGRELARIMDTRVGEIAAGLSPEDVDAVRAAIAQSGKTALAVRAVPNQGSLSSLKLDGYLDGFSPAIDPSSRTVTAIAVFPGAFAVENDGRVFADDFMTLEIEALAEGTVFELPEGALRRDSFVWRLDEDRRLVRTPVEPVQRRDGRVILRALDDLDGAEVMITPLAEETEGMLVQTARDASAAGAP